MDENKNANELNKALEGLWDSLTDEQREKAKACKTLDELTALAGKLGVELPDEMLDSVAGGVIVKYSDTDYVVYKNQFGQKIGTKKLREFNNEKDARLYAEQYEAGTNLMTAQEYNERKRALKTTGSGC